MAEGRPVVPTLAVAGAFLAQPVTGAQRHAREMLRALRGRADLPWRIVLIAPARGASEEIERLRVEARPLAHEALLDETRLPAAAWTQLRLPALLRRLGSALLWTPCGLGPLRVRRQVLTIFDASVFVEPAWFSRGFRATYRLLLPRLGRSVARVLTVSEFSRGELVRLGVVGRDRIEVVPCGVSPSFRPGPLPKSLSSPLPSGRGQRGPYVLTVGSLEPRKNLGTLLEAWSLLPEASRGERRLLVAGRGCGVFASSGVAALPGGVELMGYVPDEELPGLYSGADAFVYPSLYEGFGLPPLEAMACGVPVLTGHVASLPEVCGDAAAYCDPRSAQDMARALERVLLDEASRKELRERGLARAAELTWDHAASRLMAALAPLM